MSKKQQAGPAKPGEDITAFKKQLEEQTRKIEEQSRHVEEQRRNVDNKFKQTNEKERALKEVESQLQRRKDQLDQLENSLKKVYLSAVQLDFEFYFVYRIWLVKSLTFCFIYSFSRVEMQQQQQK